MKYVRDLHNADDNVQSISPQIHKSNRPFVGLVVICYDRLYCVPLDHPKEKHYKMKNDVDFTRIFDRDKLIGVLNFNNMIPVDEKVVKKIDLRIKPNDSSSERAYKILCAKELDWIQKNQNEIIKKANNLYWLIVTGRANNLLRSRCVNFKKLENIRRNRDNNDNKEGRSMRSVTEELINMGRRESKSQSIDRLTEYFMNQNPEITAEEAREMAIKILK